MSKHSQRILHIGIYLGEGKFLHTMKGRKSEISRLKIYRKKLIKVLKVTKKGEKIELGK